MAATRTASLADAGAIAAIEVDTWRMAYPGILPQKMLLGLDVRQRTASWRRSVGREPDDTLVACDGETVVGFGSCGRQRSPELNFAGEVFTLYVDTDFQGQGFGRLLLTALFERLIRCGFGSSVVWVLRENPSRFFYERLGGRVVAARQIDAWRGHRVDAIAFGWTDLPAIVRRSGQATSRID